MKKISYEQELVHVSGVEKESFHARFVGNTVSVNAHTLDVHKTHRRAATAATKQFKRNVKKLLRPHVDTFIDSETSEFFNLTIEVFRPVVGIREDGTKYLIKWDVSNMIKIAEDAICEAFGIDDCRILEVRGIKHHDDEHHWAFLLEASEEKINAN